MPLQRIQVAASRQNDHQHTSLKNSFGMPAALTALSRLLTIGVILLVAPPWVDATPLVTESHLILQLMPGDGRLEIFGPGLNGLTIPGAYTTSAGSSWNGLATAETGVLGRPFATARAESFTRSVVGPRGTLAHAPGESVTSASLFYQVVIVQIVPPPVPLQFLPATVNTRASAFIAVVGDPASNAAFASAQATINNIGTASIRIFSDPNSPTEETTVTDVDFLFLPGQLIDVELLVGARSRSGGNIGGPLSTSAVATAFADPVFRFDQEAFDEIARMQGFATFDLSRYFAFEDGLSSAPTVPGPASMTLVVAGGLFLAAACGRQRRQ